MTFSPQPKNKPIRLKGKAYTEFRRQVWLRAGGQCEICGVWAPLNSDTVFTMGHVAHINGRKNGDTLDNAKWKCFYCHINKEHGPRWSCMEEK